MTRVEFLEMISYNEPTFHYNGREYSICCPDGRYYVTAEDRASDLELVFDSPEELLDGWMIQGKSLGEILPLIDL